MRDVTATNWISIVFPMAQEFALLLKGQSTLKLLLALLMVADEIFE